MVAQRQRGRVAAAQMRGVRPVAEAAEVDHPLDSLRTHGLGKPRGRSAFAVGEVLRRTAAHRVDQVVGDLDALTEAPEAVRAEHVALAELEALLLELPRPRMIPAADETADFLAGGAELRRQPAADESGRPCDQHLCGHGGIIAAVDSRRLNEGGRAAEPGRGREHQ